MLLIVAEEWLLKKRKFPNWTPTRYKPQYPGNENNQILYKRNSKSNKKQNPKRHAWMIIIQPPLSVMWSFKFTSISFQFSTFRIFILSFISFILIGFCSVHVQYSAVHLLYIWLTKSIITKNKGINMLTGIVLPMHSRTWHSLQIYQRCSLTPKYPQLGHPMN